MKIGKKTILLVAVVGTLAYLLFRKKKNQDTITPTPKKEGAKYILKQDFNKEEFNISLNKRVKYEFKKGQTIVGGISPNKDTRFKPDKDSIATTPKGTLPDFDKYNEDWIEIPASLLEKV